MMVGNEVFENLIYVILTFYGTELCSLVSVIEHA